MEIRKARADDIAAIEALIARSVMGLMGNEYSLEQRRASIGPLFGVDNQIIVDGTYFVVEEEGRLVGSGGWSFRRTLFGGDAVTGRDDTLADPSTDPAHIRAFYVDPGAARAGVGSRILRHSEADAITHGFSRFEMGATLTGKRFYARHGYLAGDEFAFPLPGGLEFPLLHMAKSVPEAPASPGEGQLL
jgi:N-acetylglutamate synthase-like GNAT family acetyltransferase